MMALYSCFVLRARSRPCYSLAGVFISVVSEMRFDLLIILSRLRGSKLLNVLMVKKRTSESKGTASVMPIYILTNVSFSQLKIEICLVLSLRLYREADKQLNNENAAYIIENILKHEFQKRVSFSMSSVLDCGNMVNQI